MYGRHVAPLLTAHRIAALINLRGANPKATWYEPERATCAALGVSYLDRPLHSRRLPERRMLSDLLAAYASAPKPLLIKCSGGADRTALAAALYLLHRHGVDALPRARRQLALLPYLHLPKRHQRWIRQLPEFFGADSRGQPIGDWTRTRYSPERFADWLETRGLGASWRRRTGTG